MLISNSNRMILLWIFLMMLLFLSLIVAFNASIGYPMKPPYILIPCLPLSPFTQRPRNPPFLGGFHCVHICGISSLKNLSFSSVSLLRVYNHDFLFPLQLISTDVQLHAFVCHFHEATGDLGSCFTVSAALNLVLAIILIAPLVLFCHWPCWFMVFFIQIAHHPQFRPTFCSICFWGFLVVFLVFIFLPFLFIFLLFLFYFDCIRFGSNVHLYSSFFPFVFFGFLVIFLVFRCFSYLFIFLLYYFILFLSVFVVTFLCPFVFFLISLIAHPSYIWTQYFEYPSLFQILLGFSQLRYESWTLYDSFLDNFLSLSFPTFRYCISIISFFLILDPL